MTQDEEQQIIHAIAGVAQGVNALLSLFKEMHSQREKADKEILEVLKLISRKH